SRFLAHRWDHVVEGEIVFPAQLRRYDPDNPPVIGPAHREKQVEPLAPQIDVELIWHHRSCHLGIGDEEYMLVGRSLKRDPAKFTHRAARTVTPSDPRGGNFAQRAVGL